MYVYMYMQTYTTDMTCWPVCGPWQMSVSTLTLHWPNLVNFTGLHTASDDTRPELLACTWAKWIRKENFLLCICARKGSHAVFENKEKANTWTKWQSPSTMCVCVCVCVGGPTMYAHPRGHHAGNLKVCHLPIRVWRNWVQQWITFPTWQARVKSYWFAVPENWNQWLYIYNYN